MESPFTYNSTASGSSFLARKKEVSQTVLNIRNRVHTVIYEPPKTGKQSLIDMALAQTGLTPAVIDMISMIDSDELLHALQDTPEHTLVYIKNFQNILRLPDWERAAADLSHRMQSDDAPAYILSGSGINAMKYIFEEKKLFYRQFDRVRLSPIDERSVTDHIIKTFLRVGRVVEQSQAERIYNTADGHPCRYQLYFLKAVFDGITKVSSSDVIERYRLNSSANVHRIKEALTKKEVISIDAQDTPTIIDPIFRLWLERFYFKDNKAQ